MKKALIIIMLALLLPAGLRPETSEALNKETRIQISKSIHRIYAGEGDKRPAVTYRPFLWSASRAAKWFPVYPASNDRDRTLKLLTYGANETHFTLGMAEANIPGIVYFSGRKKVRYFSIDVMWTGMNEQNLEWTYEAARLIQQGKPLPQYIGNREFRRAIKKCHIPKEINLKRIDMGPIRQAKVDWKRYAKKGYSAKQIKKLINVPLIEETQDDVDSAMIYRILVELDRYYRGWSIDTYDKELYDQLSETIE